MERVDPAPAVTSATELDAGHSRSVSEIAAFVIMVSALLAAPYFVYPLFVMQALCFALFACAFNLLIGYGGLLSFGHALYFGWASYVAAHLAKVGSISFPIWPGSPTWHWVLIPLPPLPPELAIMGGTLAGAVLGLIAGSVAIRRQGIYFAMITLALAQMMYFFALQAKFTGGEDGIQGVPRGMLFGFIDIKDQGHMYLTALAIFLAGFLLIYRIIHSPFGEVLKAIRENEPRAISLGYKTDRYKLMAFVLSAALAGLAGSTKAIVLQIASLTDVNWPMSGEVVLMALVGGLGTVFGPVAGAFILVAMQNYLAQVGEWVSVIQGSIFVLCVLLFRRGVIGEIANLLRIKL
jgi:branched-chain amino acid transport system permease protein